MNKITLLTAYLDLREVENTNTIQNTIVCCCNKECSKYLEEIYDYTKLFCGQCGSKIKQKIMEEIVPVGEYIGEDMEIEDVHCINDADVLISESGYGVLAHIDRDTENWEEISVEATDEAFDEFYHSHEESLKRIMKEFDVGMDKLKFGFVTYWA